MSTATAQPSNGEGNPKHDDINELLKQCDKEVQGAAKVLDEARILAERAGLSVDSSILDRTFPTPLVGGTKASQEGPMTVLRTTGGHSNTDHVIVYTGDDRVDRVAELKRALQRRARATQPEDKGEDRWDQPRVPGGRRRRILREKDSPSAPPEPPPSGYVLFVAQMTTKVRHDRPNERHNQTEVVREISKIWRYGMTDADRDYYNEFAREAREEYQREHREYRATGAYRPCGTFEKLHGVGPWVRVAWEDKNALEREIAEYDTVQFPPRPPEFDEAYKKREEESKRRRKEKLAGKKYA